MDEPRRMTPEPDTRGQKIIRWVFWLGVGAITIGVFASLFFDR